MVMQKVRLKKNFFLKSSCGASFNRFLLPSFISFSLAILYRADGIDYIGVNRTVTIQAGLCIGKFTVLLIDDQIFEEREYFSYAITSSDPSIIVDQTFSRANINLTDDDGKL